MFLIALIAVTGIAWLAAGKVLAIIIAVVGGFGWCGMTLSRHLGTRQAVEERRHQHTQLIERNGLPKGQRVFRGAERKHAPTDWCDGWCDDPDGDKVSTTVFRRRANADKPIRDQKR